MFDEARNAPCIIFIDEIDAVGRQRGVLAGHDERSKPNQLLLRWTDLIRTLSKVLAATNRPAFSTPRCLAGQI